MTQKQFRYLLHRAANLARDSEFFLIGSQAIRGVCTAVPRDFPKTKEADLYPRSHPQAWSILRREIGKGSRFHRERGYYLDCADPALSTLPDGWLDRLIPFRPGRDNVTAWCLEPHDLFVAKLVAWREKDRLFLRAMLRHKFVKPKLLPERIGDIPFHDSHKRELYERLKELLAQAKTRSGKTRKFR